MLQLVAPQDSQVQQEESDIDFMEDSLMSELNRAPQPRAFWDVGTSECSSDSESAPASKQCRQHPEPVEVEEPVTADDETDMSFLMSMAMKSQRMASGHSLRYRILWNAFSKYNGSF